MCGSRSFGLLTEMALFKHDMVCIDHHYAFSVSSNTTKLAASRRDFEDPDMATSVFATRHNPDKVVRLFQTRLPLVNKEEVALH